MPNGSLTIPAYNSSFGDNSLKYVCSILWNVLFRKLSSKFPKEYTSNPFWLKLLTVAVLKTTLKIFFLENY